MAALLTLVAAAALLLLAARAPALAQDANAVSGLDLSGLDRKADPCQDFYQYACGTWKADNPIPADQPQWGRFNALQENNRAELRGILEQAEAPRPERTHVEREVGDFYAACMNVARVNALGAAPLAPELRRIAAIQTRPELLAEVARLQRTGMDVMFGFGAMPDFKNSNLVIAAVDQGGMGLPDRDYYTRTDAHSVALRKQYADHVAKMFTLLGDSPAQAAAEAAVVLKIETALAEASLERAARRDPARIYHKMTPAQLQALAPNVPWVRFFRGVGAPPVAAVDVAVPGFFTALNSALVKTSLADWKTYLRWHVVHAAAPSLSHPFVDANFDFYSKALTGAQAIQPRWKRCVRSTDAELGEALGQLYVQRYFPSGAKASAESMVGDLEASLGADIAQLPWMTAATKRQAALKLRAIVNKIGYPDKWRDYSSIVLRRDDYFGDVQRSDAFEQHRELSFIGRPPDRNEWEMTPPTVDAYYEPLKNQIVFPAGILQPPFFNPKASEAANFGGMGAVIGHELTHGFDDQGRQFDAKGNMRDWWTAADAKAFKERAQCFVKEYSAFSPIPGVHLNGQLTLGENTADNGGVRIAYAALQSVLGPGGLRRPIDGFTMAQVFFLAWGQVWCTNTRPAFARELATVDPHSPPRFRVNGVLSNDPEFAQAFHCGPSAPMNRGVKACRVW